MPTPGGPRLLDDGDTMIKFGYIFFLFIAVSLVADISCNSKTIEYDEDRWLKALTNKKVLYVKPEKVAELKEQYKSPVLTYIDDKNLYIVNHDDQSLNIYTRNDLHLEFKFGGKGEGPGEFRRIQGFKVYKDFIFVNSMGKNSYFSKKGDLLKEFRTPPHLIPCYPLGNNFVTREHPGLSERLPSNPYKNFKIVLIDANFKTKRVLFQKKLNISNVYNPKTGERESWLFPNYTFYRIYKDNIYIGCSSMESFFFTVFNSQGNKLYEIKRPYIKQKIPELIKKTIKKRQKKKNKQAIRKLEIKFYEYFPSFCNFEVADDKIFIFLYPTIDGQRVLVLDLMGKLLDSNLIPFDLKYFEDNPAIKLWFNKIHNGKKYYIRDNADTDKWELWSLKICELDSTHKD